MRTGFTGFHGDGLGLFHASPSWWLLEKRLERKFSRVVRQTWRGGGGWQRILEDNYFTLKVFIKFPGADNRLGWYSKWPIKVLPTTLITVEYFLKVKMKNKGTFHSVYCSTRFKRAKTLQPPPFWNPACSCVNFRSRVPPIVSRTNLEKTFHGMDRSVMPRQLSQLLRSRLMLQSEGMTLWF